MSEKVNIIVEGGQAKAGPQIAQPLASLGVNIQEIITKINEKTASFKGMKVPVEINVNDDKSYAITVGSPPISELIKKEIKLEKGSGIPNKNKVGNLAIEQVIKIAKMKQDSMLINNFKSAVKSVVGSCNSMGILVEGKHAKATIDKINKGDFDKEIQEQKTELDPEKQKRLEQQLKDIQEKIKKEMEKEKAEKEAEEAAKEEIAKKEAEITAEEGEEEKKEEAEAKEGETEEGEKPTEESKEEGKPEEKKEEKK